MGNVHRTQIRTRYEVQLRSPGNDRWNGVHPPDWESTEDSATALAYALSVERDHPGAEVRVKMVKTLELTAMYGRDAGKVSRFTYGISYLLPIQD